MFKIARAAFSCYVGGLAPVSVVHFVTERCNARCAHCFLDFTSRAEGDELTTAEIGKLTGTFGPSLVNVNLTGGEPFLRPDLFEIAAAYFRNAGVESVYITTNGSLTDQTRGFLDRFRASGLTGKVIVAISVDDLGEKHDENRGVKGLFTRALRTYRMADAYGHPGVLAHIAITVTDRNHARVGELYHALKTEYGVSSFTVTAMRETGAAPKLSPDSRQSILDAYQRLTGLLRRDVDAGSVPGFHPSPQGAILNAKNMVLYDLMRKIYVHPAYVIPCPAGRIFGVIAANGDVFPCEMLPGRRLGNVRESNLDFMEIWNGAAAASCRESIKKTRCNCHYECALGIGVISSLRCLPALLRHTASGLVRGVKTRVRFPAKAPSRDA